jgi:hypothetical protein
MSKRVAIPILLVAGLLWVSSAGATSYTIVSLLNGAQETPPVITLGTGTLTGTYDDVSNLLTWSGSFTALTGTTTDAHFHGPAAVGAGPAGILVPITAAGGGDVFPLGVTSGSYSGTATLSELNETRLLDGLIYINIHSTFRPGGEIRGQVFATALPEPGTLGLLGIGLGLAGFARARSRWSA